MSLSLRVITTLVWIAFVVAIPALVAGFIVGALVAGFVVSYRYAREAITGVSLPRQFEEDEDE